MSKYGMSDVQVSRVLGLFSLGLGAAEMMFGRQINQALGLGQSGTLVKAFGAREIAAGYLVRMYPDMSGPIWMRVAGDVLDIAVLVGGLNRRRNPQRDATLAALALVLGVTAIDVATAASLMRRHTKSLETARRTRVPLAGAVPKKKRVAAGGTLHLNPARAPKGRAKPVPEGAAEA